MSQDIYNILKKFNTLTESEGPQKNPKQLPALFKPKNISPVLGSNNQANPFKGYFVGGEGAEEPVINRGGHNKLRDKDDYLDKRDHLYKLLSDAGLSAEDKAAVKDRLSSLTQAAKQDGLAETNNTGAKSEAYNKGSADAYYHRGMNNPYESGTPEHAEYIKAYRENDEGPKGGKQYDESKGMASEDVVSSVKKKLGDYLQDVATAIKQDKDLIGKDKESNANTIGPAVKTITTDDGHEIKIHGNEDDGFRVTIKNKPSKSKFESLDEATMACEMFCNRRQPADESADYIEEKNI